MQQLPPTIQPPPSPRGWVVPAVAFVAQLVTFGGLIAVGLHLDHARITAGPVTWLGVVGVAGIWIRFIRHQWRLGEDWRLEQLRYLKEHPDAQLGALVMPIVKQAGITNVTEAIAEIGERANARLQKQLAEGREDDHGDRHHE